MSGRNAVLSVLGELEHQGCHAAGYRLSGETLDHPCRHLYGNDRMLIMWPSDDQALVVFVARHDRGTADVYDTLLEALGLEIDDDERTKPPCCDADDGLPPVDEAFADVVADALREVSRGR